MSPFAPYIGDTSPPPPGSQGSPAGAGRGADASSLEQHQVGGTVAAGDARFVTGTNLVPVVAGLGAAWTASVVHGSVLTLRGDTRGVRLPQHRDALPLTGATVGDE